MSKNEYIITSPSHPHYGCIGEISEDNKILETNQYIMKLNSCMHGVDRCAVSWSELAQLTGGRGAS